MNNKNILAYSILGICILCLLLGLFMPLKNKKETPAGAETSIFDIKDTTGAKIALLNIDGVISSNLPSSPWSSQFSTENFIASLAAAADDEKVKAIIIRINSPGGTVAASQDIYDAVMRARLVKPIVVSMADMAASGGYYVASAADRIVAQKGTMTGSIGVIFNFVDVASLAQKLGVNSNVIKSGKFKDAGNMYRKMSSDEQQLFQSSVNTAYGQFITAITDARVNPDKDYVVSIFGCEKYEGIAKKKLTADTLKKYADGRVFLGEEAYKLGFIDALGSMHEAAQIANDLYYWRRPVIGTPKQLPVVPYNKMSNLKSFLMGMENIFPNDSLKSMLPFSYTHNSQPLMIME